MSYQRMDHAAWIENHNAATNKYRTRKRGKLLALLPEKLTPFQAKVMDICGMVGGGIYNCSIAFNSIEWDYGGGVSVVWKSPRFATFDNQQLTTLVFLCHEARIRLAIDSAGPRMIRTSFWQRSSEGGIAKRHPSLDEAVSAFREYLPPDHRIVYRDDPTGGAK